MVTDWKRDTPTLADMRIAAVKEFKDEDAFWRWLNKHDREVRAGVRAELAALARAESDVSMDGRYQDACFEIARRIEALS